MQILFGLLGSLLIAGLAWRKRSLSNSGACAAVVVGTILYAWGNLFWFGLMIVFFVTSSSLTHWKKQRKAAAEAVYEKSGRRDAGQVLANGGAGALLCVGSALWPGSAPWLLSAYVGVMATVTADTWATEIGGLSPHTPRSIVNGRKVPPGTSGGVTVWGWLAAAGGGLVIGAAGWLFLQIHPAASDASAIGRASDLHGGLLSLLLAGTISGWLGANVDSLLGALVQAVYRCKICGRDVEAKHHCGSEAVPLKGLRMINNDLVNILSSIAGGAISMLLLHLL